ncbi:hypothetical protein H5410_053248 [Solanum commersonii]|uniref:Uncharacterized protein n=1 Tax=Solanum commersonii TaxID=4109 RepID=A0A9J5X5F2_SOLCO|nr:hypothetical protein H5410_053248 [Solanum commersonii]
MRRKRTLRKTVTESFRKRSPRVSPFQLIKYHYIIINSLNIFFPRKISCVFVLSHLTTQKNKIARCIKIPAMHRVRRRVQPQGSIVRSLTLHFYHRSDDIFKESESN